MTDPYVATPMHRASGCWIVYGPDGYASAHLPRAKAERLAALLNRTRGLAND